MVKVHPLFLYLHEPVGKVVVRGGGSAGGRIGDRCQGTGVIVGIGDGISVLIGLGQQAACLVVGILYIIFIAVGKLLQVMIDFRIGILCQGAFPDGNGGAEGEAAVIEAVGGRRGLDGGKQIVLIGILRAEVQARIGSGGSRGDPVHSVVGIGRPGGFRILRGLGPEELALFRIVAVLDGIAQSVGSSGGIIPAKPSPLGKVPQWSRWGG